MLDELISQEAQQHLSAAGRESKQRERLLAFSLGSEEYAIPLLKVKEVIACTEITPIPYTPPHFRGIMNLRGKVVSVIDLRLKFHMSAKDRSGENAIVILDLEPLCLGVVVDSVNSVVSVAEGEMSPPPDVESSTGTDCITGVVRKEKRLVLILDLEKSLSVDDLKIMHEQKTKRSA